MVALAILLLFQSCHLYTIATFAVYTLLTHLHFIRYCGSPGEGLAAAALGSCARSSNALGVLLLLMYLLP